MEIAFAAIAEGANISTERTINILGLCDTLYLARFPGVVDRLVLVFSVRGEHEDLGKQVDVRITLIDEDAQAIWGASASLQLNQADPGEFSHLHNVIEFRGLRFERPGRYRFRFQISKREEPTESLLRRWADLAGKAFRNAGRFTTSVPDPDELTARLSGGLERLGVRYALSRLAEARFIEPYAPARVVDVYVENEAEELASALELLPVERGESVRLVRPPDEGVFQFCEKREGVTLVNPVQLFVDLRNGGGPRSRCRRATLRDQIAEGLRQGP